MQRVYGFGELPHGTSNASLAFALYMAGVPFADEKQPLANIYDGDILRGLGYRGSVERGAEQAYADGKHGHVEYGFQRAAILGESVKAHDNAEKLASKPDASGEAIVREIMIGHAGGLLSLAEALAGGTCAIVKTWRRERPAWETKRSFAIQQNRNKAREHEGKSLAAEVILSGDPFRLAAVILDTREVFLNLWKNYPPVIRLHRAGKPREIGEGKVRRVRLPGFAVYSTNAERETRRHLDVPTL